jgi:hypothetical protein
LQHDGFPATNHHHHVSTTTDPNSDIARLAAHRDLHRTVPADVSAARREVAQANIRALGACQNNLQAAICHLHAILNSQRTATQSWQAEQEARQWLVSIGSEAP